MRKYKVEVFVNGVRHSDEPLTLYFKSAMRGIIELMKAFNPEMDKSITFKLKSV